jgi:hypothetical protein
MRKAESSKRTSLAIEVHARVRREVNLAILAEVSRA